MSDGAVRVRVRDGALCCATPYIYVQHQLRTYAWDGKGFHQAAGATAFYPSSTSTDLAIEVQDVVFGKPVDGVRTARVTATVRNNGPAQTEQTVLGVRLYSPM